MEKKHTPILSCTIRIDGTQGRTWQGRVLTEGAETGFRSERELLKVIEALLGNPGETGLPPGEAGPSAAVEKEEQR